MIFPEVYQFQKFSARILLECIHPVFASIPGQGHLLMNRLKAQLYESNLWQQALQQVRILLLLRPTIP
jgi:hypothetical protein